MSIYKILKIFNKKNKEQREYIKAQAELAAAEEQERKLEAEFLKKRGYDVASIYCIEDESEFDRLNEEFAAEPEEKKVWDRVCKARDKKLEAEEKLIQYALSIIPMKKEREILSKAAKTNWKARQEMLSIVMKLDTKTVRA